MSQATQRAPQGEGRMVWNNSGRMDEEEGEGQGRFARRPPVVFRPPKPAPMQPLPVHEELCEECRVVAGYVCAHSALPTSAPTVLRRSLGAGNKRNGLEKDTDRHTHKGPIAGLHWFKTIQKLTFQLVLDKYENLHNSF